MDVERPGDEPAKLATREEPPAGDRVTAEKAEHQGAGQPQRDQAAHGSTLSHSWQAAMTKQPCRHRSDERGGDRDQQTGD